MFTKRAAQGIRECERALDRNLADAHGCIGMPKYFVGRAAETEAHVREALRLSPRDVFVNRWMLFVGIAEAQLGNDAEALVAAEHRGQPQFSARAFSSRRSVGVAGAKWIG